MKTLIALAFLSLTSVTSFAGFDPVDRVQDIRNMRNRVVKCSIDFIQDNIGLGEESNNDVYAFADNLFVELKKVKNEQTKLLDLYYECKYARNNPTGIPKFDPQEYNFRYLKLVKNIASPSLNCTRFTVVAGAGVLFVGASGETGISHCTASDGKRYLFLRLGGGYTFSLPFIAYISINKVRYSLPKNSFIIPSTTSINGFAMIGGVQQSKEFEGIDNMMSNGMSFIDQGINGVLLGASGAHGTILKSVDIKIFPLPRSYSRILSQILN